MIYNYLLNKFYMDNIIDDFTFVKTSRKERKCTVCNTKLPANKEYVSVSLKNVENNTFTNIPVCNYNCFLKYEDTRQ